MIWATRDKEYNEVLKTVKCDLEADSKDEVQDGMKSDDVEGLLPGFELEKGSSVFTMDKQLGFLKSDGTWQW